MPVIRPLYVVLAAIVAVVMMNSVFITDQRELALVVQFGNPVRVVKEPGLNFKLPLAQNVIYFDRRILDMNAEPRELIAADQKRIIVDSFAKYRIVDPLKFYQTVRNEQGIRSRLNAILDSRLREVIGNIPLNTLLTEQRAQVMQHIRQNVSAEAKGFGIEVVDVRIMRADLPQANSEAIFRRMQTEREREAKEFRAQGAEEGQRIRARADKDRTVLIAEANKQAQLMRGEADATASKIHADAYQQDPEFYRFYRTLQAYREVLREQDTRMILSPDSDFLKFLSDVSQ